MKTIIVTRHKGAVEWLRQAGHVPAEGEVKVLAHLDEDAINSLAEGDVVIGVMPFSLAARLNTKGVRTFTLALDIPAEMRGKELSAEDMDNLGAQVEEVVVLMGDSLNKTRERWGFVIMDSGQPWAPLHPLLGGPYGM